MVTSGEVLHCALLVLAIPVLHRQRCGRAAFREGICTRISPSLHLHGCGGQSPWPVPLAVPTATPPRRISLAVQVLCAEGTLHSSCAYGAGDLHNRQTWFLSLTLQKPQTYPRSPAHTSETPPAGLQQDKSFICHLYHYKS